MFSYKEENIRIEDFLLDEINPRFSFAIEKEGKKYTQEELEEFLVNNYDIENLKDNIINVGGLFPAEKIICYKEKDKYIVAEGNRRICACKVIIKNEEKTNKKITKELIEKISLISALVYEDREQVELYLVNRHIEDGIKKWKPLEKNNYYVQMYKRGNSVEKIKKLTNSSEKEIKKALLNNSFFKRIIRNLEKKEGVKSLFNMDFLPIIDKVLPCLSGNDNEIGLEIKTNEEGTEYLISPDKEKLFDEITTLIGVAFLTRDNTNNDPSKKKVTSVEIKSIAKLKELIREDIRIQGLKVLIQKYKGIISGEDLKNPETEKLKELNEERENLESRNDILKDKNYYNKTIEQAKIVLRVPSPYIFYINNGEQLNILSLFNCSDSQGIPVENFSNFSCFINNKKVEHPIYLTEKKEEIELEIVFQDSVTGIVKNKIIIDCKEKKHSIDTIKQNKNIWNIDIKNNYKFDFSYGANKLYGELKKLSIDDFEYTIAASLRTLFEVSYSTLEEQKYKDISSIEKKISIVTESILDKNFLQLCSKNTDISFNTLKNKINSISVEKLQNLLNLIGHTSSIRIGRAQLEYLIIEITYLLIIMNEIKVNKKNS